MDIHACTVIHDNLATKKTLFSRYEAQIRAEQIEVLYGHLSLILPVNVVTSAGLVYVFWNVVEHSILLLWAGCMYALGGWRMFIIRRYHRANNRATERHWSVLLVLGTGLSGLVWGASGVLLFVPDQLVYQLVILFVLMVLGAGTFTSLTAYLPAFYAFLPLSMLPIGSLLILQGERITSILGAVTFLYTVVLSIFGRSVNRSLSTSLALRFENVDLVEELSAQKEMAERMNQAKSKFLAAASHDLRQPLHALSLFTAALGERLEKPEHKQLAGQIQSSVRALESLFNALLDISRLDADTLKPEIRGFRLEELCIRLHNDYLPEASAKGLTLRIDDCDQIVRSDPALLERVLRNYLSNAIRYTATGEVRLRCVPGDEGLRIEVSDTGIGIPPEQHYAVFREFYQVGNPERDRIKGLGLGLAIVERLALLLDLRIGLRSTPNKGSVFWIEVPLGNSVEPASEEPIRVPVKDELVGMLVLIIDDEREIREAMRTLLETWGCEPLLAANTEAATAALQLRGKPPHAIIADYRLREGRSGIAAISQIRQVVGVKVPALIITGDIDPERLREAKASGFPLLHKPVPPARIRAFLYRARKPVPAG